MCKYAAFLCCIFLVTLLTQAGNTQAASLSATDVTKLQRDAEQGDAKAQGSLGVAYFLGEGLPQNKTKALFWFQKAAEQGELSSQVHLGIMYCTGDGVPRDKQKGRALLRGAAEMLQKQTGELEGKKEGSKLLVLYEQQYETAVTAHNELCGK